MSSICSECKNEKKSKLSMVTMSEAAWDRNEERHRKEKNTLLIALIIAVVLMAVTNIGWLIHESFSATEDHPATCSVPNNAKKE